MDDRLKDVDLIQELDFTFNDVENQLIQDEKRYGDTWKERGLIYNDQNQEQRWYSKMQSYYTDFIEEGIPIPWDKVIGETHICKVRKKILK